MSDFDYRTDNQMDSLEIHCPQGTAIVTVIFECGGFVVHKSFSTDTGWVITHKTSGGRLGNAFKSEADAILLCRVFGELITDKDIWNQLESKWIPNTKINQMYRYIRYGEKPFIRTELFDMAEVDKVLKAVGA